MDRGRGPGAGGQEKNLPAPGRRPPTPAFIGLGSNRGDRLALLQRAIRKLGTQEVRIKKVSSLYETEPMEFEAQAWFYNAVVEVETTLSPPSLLERLQTIEREMGKKIEIPKGPRTIDLDLLFYGETVLKAPGLILPHPAAARRPFVLIPLVEIAPDLVHPLLRRTAREILNGLQSPSKVEKRSPPGWEAAGGA